MKNLFLYIGTTLVVLLGCTVSALVLLVVMGLVAIGIAVLGILLAAFLVLIAALSPLASLPVLFKRDRIRAFLRTHTNN